MSEKNFIVGENSEKANNLSKVGLGVFAGIEIIRSLNGCTNIKAAEVQQLPEEVASRQEEETVFTFDDKLTPEMAMVQEEESDIKDIGREVSFLEKAIHFVKDFDSLSYGGATFNWEKGVDPSKERFQVFYQVVESLNNNRKKFRVEENPLNIYILSDDAYKMICRSDISPGCVFHFKPLDVYPLVFLNESKLDSVSKNVFAMVLVHEYVHILQYNHKGELDKYALNVGWVKKGSSFVQPEENENFQKVITKGSLKNPSEDMAYTIMFSYVCGNNLSILSPERQEEVRKFWSNNEQDAYCQDL